MRYLALLRGINVGGNALIKMTELKVALEKDGLLNTSTYIQSGNVFFDTDIKDEDSIISLIESCIKKNFSLDIPVAIFSHKEWKIIINNAPEWWGKDDAWKHNLLTLIKPYDMKHVIESIGELKPDIERLEPGDGVLYQSMSRDLFGVTTTGKLPKSPIYKRMTVRNFNTSTKLLKLFCD